MRGYAAREIFSQEECILLWEATQMVAIVPDRIDGEDVRCHELARVIGELLKLPHQDGYYGYVNHTWLWTKPLGDADYLPLYGLPHILDVYVPGSIPQVQLYHGGSTALHQGYRRGDPRDDIDEQMMDAIRQTILNEKKTSG